MQRSTSRTHEGRTPAATPRAGRTRPQDASVAQFDDRRGSAARLARTRRAADVGSNGSPSDVAQRVADARAVVQRVGPYAKLEPTGPFAAKHLHPSPSQHLVGAMLVARAYRGWQSPTTRHTVIESAKLPPAWRLSGHAAAGKSRALTGVDRQFIASNPAVVTAGSAWTVDTKNTAKSPAVAGATTAMAPQDLSNGSGGTVSATYRMQVNHLAGAADDGLNPTTVAFDGANYTVKVGASEKTLARATVEQ